MNENTIADAILSEDNKAVFNFTVPGDPKAQGRPRFFRRGNHVGTYDPKDSASFKQKVAECAKSAGVDVLNHPIHLTLKFYLKRPKNLMRNKDPEGVMACPKRPDIDNFVKAVMDALTGIAWKDDGIIYAVAASKWYHEKNGVQRTEIRIF